MKEEHLKFDWMRFMARNGRVLLKQFRDDPYIILLIPDADDDGARSMRPVLSGGANHSQGDSKAGRKQKNITNQHEIMDYSIKASHD